MSIIKETEMKKITCGEHTHTHAENGRESERKRKKHSARERIY